MRGTDSPPVRRGRVRLHVRPNWEPTWDNHIGWTINHIKKHKWQFDPLLEMRDLLQDAYIVFMKVCDRYPRVIDPPHFMALYKTSFMREMVNQSRSYAKMSSFLALGADAELLGNKLIGEVCNGGPLAAALAQSPELQAFLNLYEDEEALEELRRPYRTIKEGPREGLNQRVLRLLGLSEDHPTRYGKKRDVVTKLKLALA